MDVDVTKINISFFNNITYTVMRYIFYVVLHSLRMA